MSTDDAGRTREDDYPGSTSRGSGSAAISAASCSSSASVVCLLVGLPETRGFFAGTLGGGGGRRAIHRLVAQAARALDRRGADRLGLTGR